MSRWSSFRSGEAPIRSWGEVTGGVYTRRPTRASAPRLRDHLVRASQDGLWNRQPDRLGRLEVDDKFELGGLLDRQIGGIRPLEDLVHIHGDAAELIGIVRAVAEEGPCLRILLRRRHHGQPV